MYTRDEIRNMIDDYTVICNTLEQLIPDLDSNSIAQYGIEATLPKPQGVNNSKVESSVLVRDKVKSRQCKLIKKVDFINHNEEQIEDDRNYLMLQLFKMGKRKSEIEGIMNIKKDEFFDRKKMIINELYTLQDSDNID